MARLFLRNCFLRQFLLRTTDSVQYRGRVDPVLSASVKDSIQIGRGWQCGNVLEGRIHRISHDLSPDAVRSDHRDGFFSIQIREALIAIQTLFIPL